MTSPLLTKVVFGAMGVMVALGVPAGLGWGVVESTGNTALAAVAVVAVIYQLMALSVGGLALSQYVPDSLPLGPSYMAGHGLLTLAMTVGPIIMLPGLVWLYVLPFDAEGYFRPGAMVSLEPDAVAQPHHEGGVKS